MSAALEAIKAGLKPGATAYYGARCCWWTTDPKDLGEIPDVGLPCCPYCGSPLLMAPAADFIASAEANASHYGAGGLDTFVRSHGTPCQHVKTWEHYAMMNGSGLFTGMSPVRFPRLPKIRSTEKTIRCTRCGSEFSEAETEGAGGCPACGSTGIPMHMSDDVTVRVNWHELRILGIWADNWAGTVDQQDPACDAKGAMTGILSRLQAQHPGKPPLTLGGELKLLRETYPEIEAVGFGGEDLLPKPEKPS